MDRTPSADARFRTLYEEKYDAMRDYCLRRLPSEDSNDALSEIFMVTWRRLDAVPEGDRARLWLFGVARKAVATSQRGTRRRIRLVAKAFAVGASGAPTTDTKSLVMRRSQDAALIEAIARLKPEDPNQIHTFTTRTHRPRVRTLPHLRR